MNTYDMIRSGLNLSGATVLEIGPLYRPFVRRSEADVIYVDHADADFLKDKYRVGHDFSVDDIVDVDAVWGENTLQDCLGEGRKADYVLASHVIEHVPDLLTWLSELRSVLKPGGEIRLVVPDKRFTFDYLRRESALQDVVDAYVRRARRPLPANLFDHVNYVRYVDVAAAWDGPLDPEALVPYHSFEMAMLLMHDALATDTYHDVHCWVFTPHSFARLMAEAAYHGLTDLECCSFRDTLRYSLEFTVFCQPSSDREKIVESWRRMERSVNKDAPDHMSTRVAELESMIESQAKATAEKDREIASLRKTVAALRASTSWRVTAPLRAVSGALKPKL